jgi:hypothetical protein
MWRNSSDIKRLAGSMALRPWPRAAPGHWLNVERVVIVGVYVTSRVGTRIATGEVTQ